MEKSQQLQQLKPEVRAYLDRIGYTGPLDGSAAVLAKLQRCHLYAVPYENLDILRGIPLSLKIDHLHDKIVTRRRGGYCFELNALFGWLLRELGYDVTDLVARFWRDSTDSPPKRRHQVLKVIVDGQPYLCDVGVGGIVPREPIAMNAYEEQRQGEETYRLEPDAQYGWFLTELKHGEWHRIYSFTEEPQLAGDYEFATFWCENAPDSIFRQTPILAIRTEEGRNTAFGSEVRLFKGTEVEVLTPENDAEFDSALEKYFGIKR
ncbi:N-hydroxyarylamine O-acetyltransferase [Paenibacillus taihuensis]|uniref:N-hydroxyarylamine O-acetyltransferase n=1 Tax=Paenibacillus taihuensis TaxID=1156355 RepID=A0A3D9RSB5_9BACL|nr:arylamine N-acetyltransferase [Paenibacillus taihuensis]REE78931.1 N-hydroxyarylamine O-acetyltransferase [Paenibacillus taihuensis]